MNLLAGVLGNTPGEWLFTAGIVAVSFAVGAVRWIRARQKKTPPKRGQ